MRISHAEDLKHGQWIFYQNAWWQIDKVEETDLVENAVILHMHIPKEHFPQRAVPVQELHVLAIMMVSKNFEFETREDINLL